MFHLNRHVMCLSNIADTDEWLYPVNGCIISVLRANSLSLIIYGTVYFTIKTNCKREIFNILENECYRYLLDSIPCEPTCNSPVCFVQSLLPDELVSQFANTQCRNNPMQANKRYSSEKYLIIIYKSYYSCKKK